MRVNKGFLRRGLTNKVVIGISIAFLVVAVAFVLWFITKKVCNQENNNIFYLLTALKTNSESECNKISLQSDREACLAAIKKTESVCSAFPNGERSNFCLSMARNNAELCKDDVVCKVLISKNPDDCHSIDTPQPFAVQKIPPEHIENAKKTCRAYATLDAEFFTAKDQLKLC